MGLSSHSSSKNPLSTLAQALLCCRELQPLKGLQQSPGHPHASPAGTFLVLGWWGGMSGSTDRQAGTRGRTCELLPQAPQWRSPSPSLLSVRANLIPSPPTFNSDYGYISWEAYANVSYYTRVLPPVPDDCPTPMGTKGTWLVQGTHTLSVSHPAVAKLLLPSARHHWQCYVLSLSCPGWLCSRRSLMASRLLLGQRRLSCWDMSWPV